MRGAAHAVMALIVAAGTSPAAQAADAEREADVARRGAQVMPFDLAATTHVFTETPHGGIQRVVAKRRSDAAQVRLVRMHLREIQRQFERRDFSAPARIHGDDMPGLAELKAAAPGAVAVAYRDVDGGAELRYLARDERLVDALHHWFDAQLSDHGHDAMAGHAHRPPQCRGAEPVRRAPARRRARR